MKTTTLLIGLILNSAFAFAGNEGGGGGKGFICRNPDFSESVYLADTYNLVKSGKLKDATPEEADSTVAAMAAIVDQRYPQKIYQHPLRPGQKVSLGWMMEYKYASLYFKSVNKVPEHADDHITQVPAHCTKVQLAYQNLATQTVEENFNFTWEMSWLERGLLAVHEIFVGLRNQPGQDTTPIRDDVAKFAAVLDDPNLQLPELLKSYLGLPKAQMTEDEWGVDFYRRHRCFDLLNDYAADRTAPGYALCQKAALINQRVRIELIPSLLRVPARLVCQTTAGEPGHSKVPAGLFTVTRESGPGTPTWLKEPWNPAEQARRYSVYRVRFANGAEFKSEGSALRTDNQRAAQWVRPFGKLNAEMRFSVGNLVLNDFNPRTQLFSGSFGSYGVVCDGGQPEFGLDHDIP